MAWRPLGRSQPAVGLGRRDQRSRPHLGEGPAELDGEPGARAIPVHGPGRRGGRDARLARAVRVRRHVRGRRRRRRVQASRTGRRQGRPSPDRARGAAARPRLRLRGLPGEQGGPPHVRARPAPGDAQDGLREAGPHGRHQDRAHERQDDQISANEHNMARCPLELHGQAVGVGRRGPRRPHGLGGGRAELGQGPVQEAVPGPPLHRRADRH
mmetsp:Transcript_43628/g.123484  ORF Transcript_43628/g.123484 Transcript_43628/m.123484 type:complete len:212 (+) Transcript_43628:970-1605(+)